MGLLHLPNELILLITSFLDDANDKAAFLKTCRRVYEVAKSDLCRLLAVDQHANVAIHAALTGETAILDLLWPYNPRFVKRLWEHDPDLVDGAWPLSDLCFNCAQESCDRPDHQSRQGNSTLDQALLVSVFDRCDLGRATACFDRPKGLYTLLHFAALYNDTEMISWLLDHGADIDAVCILRCCKEVQGEEFEGSPTLTALQLAISNRNEEAAKLLIERGARINRRPNGRNSRTEIDCYTPAICVTAAFGMSDTVRLFLERGESIGTTDERGYTALHHAADRVWEEEYFGIFKVLAEEGANLLDDSNETSRSPIEIAFRQGNFAVVDSLLSLGAGLDSLERNRLGLAENRKDFLLQFACAFEARSRGLRYTQHSCFSISRTDEQKFSQEGWEKARFRLVVRLLDLGYDPNGRASLDHRWSRDDVDGYVPPRGQADQAFWEIRARSTILPRRSVTALNALSVDCDPELVALLIDRGAEVDAQDADGLTLLWLMCVDSLQLDKFYPDWDSYYSWVRPYEWQRKMGLVLRAGAKIDPWAVSTRGGASTKLLQLVHVNNCDMFSFLMKKMTPSNMSHEALRTLSLGVVYAPKKVVQRVDAQFKHERVCHYHGPFDYSKPLTVTYDDDSVMEEVLARLQGALENYDGVYRGKLAHNCAVNEIAS
ncbi:ankyrin repeat-containing domain protein [Coniochaeta sp. 2T2.1]|nr:ankyrin repeat-containing domain protein [Coniochaeta sp. 2T2.1]